MTSPLLSSAVGRGLLCTLALAVLPTGGPRAAEPTGLPVTVVTAQAAQRPQTIEASGAIAAFDEASIAAVVAGLPVLEAPVRVGDSVTQGQLLVAFDAASVRAEVGQAQAALAAASAALATAVINQNRSESLRETGTVSEQAILQATTEVATAQAQVDQARATLTRARLNLSRARIVAPESGLVSARAVTVGAVPAPGTELYRLILKNRLEWRAELPGAELARIRVGMAAHVRLAPDVELRGTVRQVAPSLDPRTRLGLVYVDLERTDLTRAGVYVAGALELEDRAVLLVPPPSVVIRDGHTYAVTLEQDHATLVPVTIGRRSPADTEVLSGLKPGQRVIVRGAGFVADGMKVQVVAPPATP